MSMSEENISLEVIRDSLSGKFLEFEDYDVNQDDIHNSDNFDTAFKETCERCGEDVFSENKEFDCPKCGLIFEREDAKNGFRLVDGDLGVYEDYQVKIVEHPHIFYKKKTSPQQKYILFSDSNEDFQFIDKAGQFVVLDVSNIQEYREGNLTELIQKFRNKRKQLLDWKKLDTDEREFQHLIFEILDRDSNFEVNFSGAEGNEGGMDASVYYTASMTPYEVIVQCKRNTSQALSPTEVQNIIDKIDLNLDGSMVLIACISVSGNVRKAQRRDKFLDENIHEVTIWQKEEISARLCKYPNLIRRFFY